MVTMAMSFLDMQNVRKTILPSILSNMTQVQCIILKKILSRVFFTQVSTAEDVLDWGG